MGCDGGSIPQRPEMVKTKKAPEKKDPVMLAKARWLTCAISGAPLTNEIVADEMGNIFNKEAILERLLSKNLPEKLSHIRRIKDLITLRFDRNRAYDFDRAEATKAIDEINPLFVCPVTGEEANGHHRFVTLFHCGHVISEGAMKHFPEPRCPVCRQPFRPEDVIVLNGNEEDEALLKQRAIQRRLEKKTKRIPAVVPSAQAATATATATATVTATTGAEEGGPAVPVPSSAESVAVAPSPAVADSTKQPRTEAHRGPQPHGPSAAEPKRAAPPGGGRKHSRAESEPEQRPAAIAAVVNAVKEKLAEKARVPANADPAVYRSLFQSSRPPVKENFLYRNQFPAIRPSETE
ncbi:putative protein RTF2 [Paratrimastix pyriformis]|uniref:Replication termination factor 2 n=1 Tax=Paratrimastix pyriformis TaxID=342808 RepID=A0ABQ8USB0_9EUKA|nr:putative protein RTF2 [Paratrimastix pyriformis]